MAYGAWSRVIAGNWPHLRFAAASVVDYHRPFLRAPGDGPARLRVPPTELAALQPVVESCRDLRRPGLTDFLLLESDEEVTLYGTRALAVLGELFLAQADEGRRAPRRVRAFRHRPRHGVPSKAVGESIVAEARTAHLRATIVGG